MVDNRLGSVWLEESSTGINCNSSAVVDYVGCIDGLAEVSLDDITVLMPINADVYAGTANLDDMPSLREPYGQGFTIGMCPVSRTRDVFREVIVHEVGGHCFAKLIDEYYTGYNPYETIPQKLQDEIAFEKGRYGWYENVDFYSDIMQTSWSGFANNPKYSMVGTYEGGYRHGYGIWRPEYNSCMNNNVFYFNAPSRWAQVRRIMYLAGFEYSFSRFLTDDKVPVYPTSARSVSVEKFVPFAPPVISSIPDTRKRRKNREL
jgi:hypothetical protein